MNPSLIVVGIVIGIFGFATFWRIARDQSEAEREMLDGSIDHRRLESITRFRRVTLMVSGFALAILGVLIVARGLLGTG